MEIVQSNESHNGDSCPNCKNSELTEDENRGELFCKKCGYVAPQKLEEYDLPHGTDKHGVSTDSSGVAYRYGRSSIIDKANKDFTGKNIQGEMKQSLDRLRVWDTRASANDNKVRSMNKAAPKIMGWCSSLGVNENAISEAIRIYAKAQKAGITRGRSINTIALASIKIACKLNNITRNDMQLCEVSGVKPKQLGRGYKNVFMRLNITVSPTNVITDPNDYLSQIASKLNVSQRTVRRAAQLLEDAKKAELLDGRSRTGIAAAAIYIACVMEGETVTQRNVSNASKISEVTIRHHQQLFVKGLKLVSIRLACIESKQQVESLKICKAISANESSISAATWKIDKGLGLNLRTAGKVYCKGDFTDPKAHVLKIGETLNLSSHVTSRAEELLVKVQEKKIFLRRSSRVIALTVLYFAAQGTEQKMTQKSLADAGKINPSSLHSALAELSEAFGIETRHKATQEERAQKIREASQRQKKKLKDSRVKELGNFALKLTDTLNLDSTSAEEAKRIWSMAKDKQVIQGRDEAGILCAAVYAACRLKDSFHSLREIVSRANELNGKSFDYGVIAGYYNTLIQELEIKMPPPDIATGVLQLAQRCDVSESTKNMALKILKRVGDEVVGANPYTLSGAILYGAARLSGNLKTQAEIARVTGVSEVSLRNNIKKLNV